MSEIKQLLKSMDKPSMSGDEQVVSDSKLGIGNRARIKRYVGVGMVAVALLMGAALVKGTKEPKPADLDIGVLPPTAIAQPSSEFSAPVVQPVIAPAPEVVPAIPQSAATVAQAGAPVPHFDVSTAAKPTVSPVATQAPVLPAAQPQSAQSATPPQPAHEVKKEGAATDKNGAQPAIKAEAMFSQDTMKSIKAADIQKQPDPEQPAKAVKTAPAAKAATKRPPQPVVVSEKKSQGSDQHANVMIDDEGVTSEEIMIIR